MNPIELTVNGTAYAGWTSLRASTSIEHASGSFELGVTDRWGAGELPFQVLKPGVECTLTLAGQTVITGWIDAITREIDERDCRVTLSGRDKTADLVDCSARVPSNYDNRTLEQIAEDQCRDYGIPVSTTATTGAPFKRVVVEPGESVFELLERLARQRGVLLMPDGQGGLIIGQVGTEQAPAPLVLGGNLRSLRYTLDFKDRFSEYQGLGQSAGRDEWSGKQAAQVQASATDDAAGAGRVRRKIIVGETGETDLKARVDWERAVRYGRSLSMQARVVGWAAAGELWRMNTQVVVRQRPRTEEDITWLIAGVTYTLDNQSGTIADLDLVPPEAYTPEPPKPETPNSDP